MIAPPGALLFPSCFYAKLGVFRKAACPMEARYSRSSLDDMTRPTSLGGYPSLQFSNLLFEFDDDAPDLVKSGTNSRDQLSGGLSLVPQPFQLCFRSHVFPRFLHVHRLCSIRPGTPFYAGNNAVAS